MKLLFIRTSYCGTCKQVKNRQIDPIARKIGWDNVLEVDGMQNLGIAKRYGVTKVPTTLVVDGNEVLYRAVGKIDVDTVEKLFATEKLNKKKTEAQNDQMGEL